MYLISRFFLSVCDTSAGLTLLGTLIDPRGVSHDLNQINETSALEFLYLNWSKRDPFLSGHKGI